MRLRKRIQTQGFTLIEVMATLVVTIIGLSGLFLTELATSHAQESVRDMVYAVNLADLTINDIRLEGLEWTTNSGQGINQTKLKRLSTLTGTPQAGKGTSWTLAFNSSTPHIYTVGPSGGDFSENYTSSTTPSYDDGIKNEFPLARMRRYCVWYRLIWLIPNYAIRADVRVAWPKKNALNSSTNYWGCPVSMVADINQINFITLSSTINVYSSVQ